MRFGVAFAWGATTYSVGTCVRMGPRFFTLMLGCALGILPGVGALLSAFTAYALENKRKMKPGEVPFSQGSIRGVASPESANNAGSQVMTSNPELFWGLITSSSLGKSLHNHQTQSHGHRVPSRPLIFLTPSHAMNFSFYNPQPPPPQPSTPLRRILCLLAMSLPTTPGVTFKRSVSN